MDKIGNGGLHGLAWIIIILIFASVVMLVHFETAGQKQLKSAVEERREATLDIRQDIASLHNELLRVESHVMVMHKHTQELIIEAQSLREAVKDCGRITPSLMMATKK